MAGTDHSIRAARLVVLLELQEAGLLKDRTQQELADAFGMAHRSAICRDLRELKRVRKLAAAVRLKLRGQGY